ncbi:maleylpyruvate isomerase family mycothiol-dependent enzyme [Paramicrobacterium agarici]|uniref:Uncharacterized protein (TIGR03083 family) n=1 Tax=Paramicrobacterium agarici TaxID=630514 RepID=A0A2A9DYQ6_9MICO|nr:maleylpyruvate isomerase family mycothiol-dependent enzyme [Microbacterium agarici]PFG31724.1 uncharacterized protein (TIGR03083 family) [Microbacterium agarici]
MTTTPDTDMLMTETLAERHRLIELAEQFGDDDWSAPSLCDGWRIREVVAHLTMPYRLRPLGYLVGMLRHGFKFDRFAQQDALGATSELSDAELLKLWQSHADSRWQPPGGGPAGALSHELIHGLDVTVALGLPNAPAERLALMLRAADDRNFTYFGVDLTGVRLEADDADATVGHGSVIRLPVHLLVLVVTGRRRLDDVREAA